MTVEARIVDGVLDEHPFCRLVLPSLDYRRSFAEGAAEFAARGRLDSTYAPFLGYDLAGLDVDFVRSNGDWLLMGRQAGGLLAYKSAAEQETLLTTHDFVDADAVVIGTTWYIAGLRDDGSVLFAYGPKASLTQVVLPTDTPDGSLTATSVALAAGTDRVIISVGGSDGADRIGWAILQR